MSYAADDFDEIGARKACLKDGFEPEDKVRLSVAKVIEGEPIYEHPRWWLYSDDKKKILAVSIATDQYGYEIIDMAIGDWPKDKWEQDTKDARYACIGAGYNPDEIVPYSYTDAEGNTVEGPMWWSWSDRLYQRITGKMYTKNTLIHRERLALLLRNMHADIQFDTMTTFKD